MSLSLADLKKARLITLALSDLPVLTSFRSKEDIEYQLRLLGINPGPVVI